MNNPMPRHSIYNDDSQGLHEARPESAESDLQAWVDRPLTQIPIDTYAWCIAFPDIVHHDSKVGEVYGRRFGQPPDRTAESVAALSRAGTDVMHVVADQARRHGVEIVASVRMGDTHHRQPDPDNPGVPKLLLDNPEYAIRRRDGIAETALDYSHDEVRAHRLAILKELAEDYDIDGVELDFTRWGKFFVREEAPFKTALMTEFVGQVRAALDTAARRRGRDRLRLGVQVQASPYLCLLAGLDPCAWLERDWLDYLIQCDHNCTDPQMPVAEFAEMCRDRRCTHHVRMGNMVGGRWTARPHFDERRTAFKNTRGLWSMDWSKSSKGYGGMVLTVEEARGAAANAYGFGADGIGYWNLCCNMHKPDAHAGVSRKQFQEDMIEWARAVARPESVWAGPRTYHFVPIYKGEGLLARNYAVNAQRIGPMGEQTQIVVFSPETEGMRQRYRFLMADGRDGQKLSGTMRFPILNSTLEDGFDLDVNGVPVDGADVRRTVGGDDELPLVWHEIDLANCPPFRGDNELGITPRKLPAPRPHRDGGATLYEPYPYLEQLIVSVDG